MVRLGSRFRVLLCAVLALLITTQASAAASGETKELSEADEAVALDFFRQLAEGAGTGGTLTVSASLLTNMFYERQAGLTYEELLACREAFLKTGLDPATVFAPASPTGDALYDRYVATVRERLLAMDAYLSLYPWVVSIPDDELATWESDFGADPRYWELRYYCATHRHAFTPRDVAIAAPTCFLAEALRRGVARCKTLLQLATADLDGLDVAVELPVSARLDGIADPAAREMRRQELVRLALLDLAVARYPEQAWAYYARAEYWFDLGEQERGLADLAAGNEAPQCDYPWLWPASELIQGSAAAERRNDVTASGALWATDWHGGQGGMLINHMRQHIQETLLCANLSGDLSAFEAWHQFACRIGMQEGDNPIVFGLAVNIFAKLRRYLAETCGDELGAGQRDTLDRIYAAQRSLPRQFPEDSKSGDVKFVLNQFNFGQGYAIGGYVNCLASKANLRGAAAVFADLSQVHYPELALPQCMEKYQPLADEANQN